MADEPGVDERDALARRDGLQQGAGLLGARGDPDVEAERPQISVERGSGCRRAGEDGGRQTNSLLGADEGPAARGAAVPPGAGRRHVD
ncbi:hypothetical protein [Streptomyces sp. NPDC059593]|uniref:hypothetical protein n=1 Tax=Streptomyces sp. NPDC059593 TaxID=3346878 RepID=UPI00368643AE